MIVYKQGLVGNQPQSPEDQKYWQGLRMSVPGGTAGNVEIPISKAKGWVEAPAGHTFEEGVASSKEWVVCIQAIH